MQIHCLHSVVMDIKMYIEWLVVAFTGIAGSDIEDNLVINKNIQK